MGECVGEEGLDLCNSCARYTLTSFPLNSLCSSLVTMSEDFIRLVSQANPAARQYQPANNGYPPSSSQQLDPFFDDDDEYEAPDSAFGAPAAMHSQESGLPLARSGAAPAGHSQLTLNNTIPSDWSFEDDIPGQHPAPPPGKPPAGVNAKHHQKRPSKSFKQRWRWPWSKKEEVLQGNRVVVLNHPVANAEFCSNYVSTSKYNVVSFVPKFLFGGCIASKVPGHWLACQY